MLFLTFLVGFIAGEFVGELRWKRAAYEARELAAKAIARIRVNQGHRPK